MIPYGRQNISEADINAVIEVLRSDWLTQGPMVPHFERMVAEYVGSIHAVAVNSATSALHIACLALDVGPGDWVWTSPNTFVASANCVLYCGAKVDFVDIDPYTYNMSVEHLAEKLQIAERINRLPKVVIPVHFAGQPCDMLAIHSLAQKYGFRIIEDASHAIGASYKHNKIGSCTYSDITVFSFHPVKIITTGEGGIATTRNSEVAERMRLYRSHGITNNRNLMRLYPPDEIWNYQQIDLGFNYRMTDIQAGLGLSQIKRIDQFLQNRNEIANRYNEAFHLSSIIAPWVSPEVYSSYHLYPIRIEKIRCGKTQREVYTELQIAGVGVNLHYIPVYRQPFYQALGFQKNYCPVAEKYFKEAISLPIFPGLDMQKQHLVIDTLIKSLR